jgi:hypothetical protein
MRNRITGLLTCAATLVVFGTLAFAQTPNPGLIVRKLKDNIYVAEGGGGTSTIIKQALGEPAKNASRFPTFTETTYEELTRK